MAAVLASDLFAQKHVAGFLNTRFSESLRKALGDDKDALKKQIPAQAFENLICGGKATPQDVEILQLLQTLWNVSNDAANSADPDLGGVNVVAPSIYGWILTQLNSNTSHQLKDQLVGLLFPQAHLDNALNTVSGAIVLEPTPPKELTGAVLSQLRFNVFNVEPLRTINRLVGEGKFTEAFGNERLFRTVKALLPLIIKEAIDIGNTKLVTEAAQGIEATKKDISDVLEAIISLKGLARVSENPEDIPIIYGKRYVTIRHITQADKESWVPQMVKAGIKRENALKIYDCAERIDCWNENLWLTLMQSRRAGFTPIAAREVQQISKEDNEDDLPPRAGSNLTDTFQLEDMACETCCSVTSLSAYFADLLSLLRATPCGTKNLLERLRLRRPDLTKLQLTCANAQTLVPYVSLVNEVLESYIKANSTKGFLDYDSVRAFNTPESDTHNHSDTAVYHPGNTDPEVYAIVGKQMFPFSVFPYNQPRDAISQYFATFGVTMLDLIKAFQAIELVIHDVPAAIKDAPDADAGTRLRRIDADMRETLERSRAAEALGLQLADFVAITGETFYPKHLSDILVGSSASAIPTGGMAKPTTITPAMAAAAAKTALLDPTKGLSSIKKQLMRRSGLDFQEILDLVKTQCFGQHLVITNKSGSQTFSSEIEDLRLLSSAAQPPFRPLTEELAFALQSFMRVQAKLKWSTKQLDSAVVCFRNLEMSTSPHTLRGSKTSATETSMELMSISPFVLKSLSAVKSLSEISGIECTDLLPLWGPIDTFGDSSLMHRKFLTPAAAEVDKFFALPGAKGDPKNPLGDYFRIRQGTKLATSALTLRKMGICASLNWPVEYFGDLLAASGQGGKELTVTTFSALYRSALICRILSISPSQCGTFFPLFSASGGQDSLSSPLATVDSIEKWKRLFDDGWTVSSLSTVLNPPSALPAGQVGISGLATAASILEGAQGIRKTVPYVSDGNGRSTIASSPGSAQVVTALSVADCSARTFDSVTASQVIEFVEGSQIQVERMEVGDAKALESLMKDSNKLPFKITLTPEIGLGGKNSVELQLVGILSPGETEVVQSLSIVGLSDATSKDLKETIMKMAKQAIEVQEKIASRFGKDKFTANLLSNGWPEVKNTRDDEPQLLAEIELLLRDRRKAFVDLAGPAIIQDLLEAFLLNVSKELVPDMDVSLVAVLISRIARVPASDDDANSISAMAAMKALSETMTNPVDKPLDAFFTPSSTDIITLHYTGQEGTTTEEAPLLQINGVTMSYSFKTKTFMSTRMRGGEAYLLTANFPSSMLLWSTPKLLPSPMTDKSLLPSVATRRASEINAAILRVAAICRTMSLTPEEVGFFCDALQAQQTQAKSQSHLLAIDLSNPSLDDLLHLGFYCDLRRNTTPAKRDTQGNPLLTMFSWLSTSTSATVDDIAHSLYLGTGWDKSRVTAALKAKYIDAGDADTSKVLLALREIDAISSLYSIMQLDQKLGRATGGLASQPAMATLFGLAQPPKLLSADDSSTARSLQMRLLPNQRAESYTRLMENQRRVLVAYLLQQQYVRKGLKIWDADGLFEHFLIDVQMGPQLSISRIKQAISVVQLFVQRCFLGLEPDVPKNCLVRAKWDWMQQYSMWEAQRKLFLYPENWLDPSLRDDKSLLFEKFESSLMQKNLSIESFTESIRAYIGGLNELSSLETIAYAHQPVKDVSDTFHLFGRTRSAPHGFYYRNVRISWPSGARIWRPWSKIDLDIASVETDWDGSRLANSGAYLLPVLTPAGRLYLFLPQIMPRMLDKKESPPDATKDFESLREKKIASVAPRRIWEITMAWTELQNGNWAPKRMSPGSVTIESASMPTAADFRVDTIQSVTGSLSLIVSYTEPNSGGATVIGYFVFRADQISAVDLSADAKDATVAALDRKLPTCFQQISLDLLAWVPPALDKLNRKSPATEVMLPRGQAPSSKLTWTLAMDAKENRLTGLAVSSKRADGTSMSYFNLPRAEMSRIWWTAENMQKGMDTVVMDHVTAPILMQASADPSSSLQSIYVQLVSSASSSGLEAFGAYEKSLCHELGQPNALFNWEIGLHAVMSAMDRFYATQQFEEALEVARLVFDPTVDAGVERLIKQVTTKPVGSAWRFPPFQDIARRITSDGQNGIKPSTFNANTELQAAILERRSHGALVHATARGRPEAYMKWIVLKYIEILVASGDIHFRRATLESLPLATQRYVEAAHVLGPEPPRVARFGDRKSADRDSTFEELTRGRDPWTFERLYQEDMSFGVRLPFSPELELIKGAAEKKDKDRRKENVVGFLHTPYFGVPMNPKFRQVRSTITQRLFNIRNSLDINGRPITYALIEPSIDPGALVALSAQGYDNSAAAAMVMGDRDSPLPCQRFEFLIHRAVELCSEVRGLGERLVTAIEKKESEAYGVLRAKHQTVIQRMMCSIKETHMTEARQTIDSLRQNRESLESQLAYYLALIGEPLSLIPSEKDSWSDLAQNIKSPVDRDMRASEDEKHEMDMATAAMVLNVVSAGIDTLVAPFCMIPSVSINAMPMGIGTTVAAGGGGSISNFMQAGSAALKMAAMVVAEQGSQASRKAQLTRQLQERRLQANMRGREIKGIDLQIKMQYTRLKATQQELELQQSEMEEADQIETWLRTKYTNEQLYTWVEKGLRNLYLQAYTLAMTTARSAEKALSFESGHKLSILRPGGYWDASREGLLSADHLFLDLKRLEATYREGRRHDYEISKTVSLRQIDPMALIRLRITGSTVFSFSEMLFDMDFPGHHMRRIRSVAVTIPAVLGPHSAINATLTLQQHKYRVLQTASTPEEYASSWSSMSCGSDEAFRTDRVPICAVAISSGSHDSGVFDLNFAGDRYLPFEGAGAISSWRLDIPTEFKRFDYSTIADVQIHLQYTSLEGGACLRAAANGAVRNALKAVDSGSASNGGGLYAMWSLSSDFVNEWYGFTSQLDAARKDKTAGAGTKEITMKLGDLHQRLPFWAKDLGRIEVRNITLVSKHVEFVDALTISVAKGAWDSQLLNKWRVRSYPKAQVQDWKEWEFKIKPSSLKEPSTVGDVYMLLSYRKASSN
ncbi:hypothetical protein DER45DRAFT_493623 [Fusarium avenaceum]|nr:hypothetical protein DER45DRAFT_493623 [Fusarium avenaceum]